MDKEELIKFLVGSDLVSSNIAEEIGAVFSRKEIAKNEFYLKWGSPSNEYFFLETGFMRAFTFDPEGNEVTTAFYSAKQVVFEGSSFFNRTISKESIQALTDCKGWVIDYDQLNMLFHSIPQFREFGRFILVKGITSLKQRMLSMINETAEERYDTLIKNNPEIFQYAPLKNIASYLGITDSSLSRIRAGHTKNK